jgi:hypothetical protein
MFSATTDLWTSEHQNTGYICVTLHCINAEFELIGFEEMKQHHSGVNLALVLYRIFSRWDIEPKIILRIVMDNASNSTRFVEEFIFLVIQVDKEFIQDGALLRGHCAAHVVNLVANVGIQFSQMIEYNVSCRLKAVQSKRRSLRG